MTRSRRDGNETAIVEAWRDLGALWVPMSRYAGFDGLLLYRGQAFIVEVKHGTKAKLTAAECEQKERVEAAGVAYHIVRSLEEALELVEGE